MWSAILELVALLLKRWFKWKDRKPVNDMKKQKEELERRNQQAMKEGNLEEMWRTRAELEKLQRES